MGLKVTLLLEKRYGAVFLKCYPAWVVANQVISYSCMFQFRCSGIENILFSTCLRYQTLLLHVSGV